MAPAKNTCALCWDHRHKCRKPEHGSCRDCVNYLIARNILGPESIAQAPLFYNTGMFTLTMQSIYILTGGTGIHDHLFQDHVLASSSSIETHGIDSNTLFIRIKTSKGPVIDLSHAIQGSYTAGNKTITNEVDAIAQKWFCAPLRSKFTTSEAIPAAILAGGIAHLLCSVINVTEQATTFYNGLPGANEFLAYNLEAQFKYLLVCRLQPLLNQVLEAVRQVGSKNRTPQFCSDAYAAAVILRYELDYFKSNIRNGSLRAHISQGLKTEIFNWFDPVERELMDRIRVGCGQFPFWREDAIKGSMRTLRRHGETCSINMHLVVHKNTMPTLSPDVYHAPTPYPLTLYGDGYLMLGQASSTSRPPSALFQPLDPPGSLIGLPSTVPTSQGTYESQSFASGDYHVGVMSDCPLDLVCNPISSVVDDMTDPDPQYLSNDWYAGYFSDGL